MLENDEPKWINGELLDKESLNKDILILLNRFEKIQDTQSIGYTQISPEILAALDINTLYSIRNNLLKKLDNEIQSNHKDWLLSLAD